MSQIHSFIQESVGYACSCFLFCRSERRSFEKCRRLLLEQKGLTGGRKKEAAALAAQQKRDEEAKRDATAAENMEWLKVMRKEWEKEGQEKGFIFQATVQLLSFLNLKQKMASLN